MAHQVKYWLGRRVVSASGHVAVLVILVAACAAQSESLLSADERAWCRDPSNANVNIYAVAHAMDRLDIPEPSPGFLRARMESRGRKPLGDSPPSWTLAAFEDAELIQEVATSRPTEYRQACRAAYEDRGSIIRLDSASP